MENQTTAPVATGQSDVQQNVASSVQAPTTLAVSYTHLTLPTILRV